MNSRDIKWENIKKLKEHFITYLLYKEGKTIETIASIRRMTKLEVEKDIIKSKIELNGEASREDLLLKIISMGKNSRIKYLERLDELQKNELIEEIIKRYTKFKNPEDKMIIIWMMGELKDKRFLPYLRMEMKSNNVNYRRLACSALGKIKDKSTREWLEELLNDQNPQVRQYAINSLSCIGNLDTVEKLRDILSNNKEKDYVKRAAIKAIERIREI